MTILSPPAALSAHEQALQRGADPSEREAKGGNLLKLGDSTLLHAGSYALF